MLYRPPIIHNLLDKIDKLLAKQDNRGRSFMVTGSPSVGRLWSPIHPTRYHVARWDLVGSHPARIWKDGNDEYIFRPSSCTNLLEWNLTNLGCTKMQQPLTYTNAGTNDKGCCPCPALQQYSVEEKFTLTISMCG